ncbi:MAG: hypothetical protein R3B93_15795 [Bacteroidia bacterium]
MNEQNASSIQFIRYFDPKENAFSIAMPMGWNSQVSMERPYGIIRSCGVSVSPDQRTSIFFGDPTLPMFQMPNPMMFLFRGMNTGNPLKQVENFIPAQHFTPHYVETRYGHFPGFRIHSVQPNPFIRQHSINKLREIGLNAPVTEASVLFTFQENGQTVYGQINGVTINLEIVWSVDVTGFLTMDDPEKTEPILNQMVSSHQTNPAWLQRENAHHQQVMNQMNHNHQMRMQQMQQQFQSHQNMMQQMYNSADAQNQQWRDQQQINDQRHEQFIDYIRDETTITNGHQTAKVEAGYNSYYVNQTTGEYIGVNNYENPDPTIFEHWKRKW